MAPSPQVQDCEASTQGAGCDVTRPVTRFRSHPVTIRHELDGDRSERLSVSIGIDRDKRYGASMLISIAALEVLAGKRSLVRFE